MDFPRRTALLLNTVRRLRPRQVTNRILRRVLRPVITPGELVSVAPGCRPEVQGDRPVFLPRPVSFSPPDGFDFLNEPRVVPADAFATGKKPLLWDYNFHYFDGLLATMPSRDAKCEWVAQWIRSVPVGSVPAWDPYPTSRRIGNWVKWAIGGAGDTLPSDFRRSLATQARMLERSLEYHLMANHLLANAVALALVGAYFEGPDGDRWLGIGMGLLESEVDEQILDDGGHFELSPAYHALILEDLLDLVQVLRSRSLEVPSWLVRALQRSARWLRVMQRPDGRLPLFNDASDDMARPSSLVLDHAARLGVAAEDRPERGITHLGSSGYFRYDWDRLVVLGDLGPIGPTYQPGHGHCDMLSFDLSWDGVPVIVDTGTSTYEVGDRRSVERGTAAHNTVQVGSMEQSEVWGGFRVARRAVPLGVDVSGTQVQATIRAFPEGWSELRRDWSFDGESVEIRDTALKGGAVSSTLTARLHFHPASPPQRDASGWTSGGLAISFSGASEIRDVEYLYAPEFNRRVPARCLEARFSDGLVTRIEPVS